MKDLRPISLTHSLILFGIPGIIFYLNVKIVIPYLSDKTNMNQYVLWIIIGTLFLFLPLFVLTLAMLKIDRYEFKWKVISERLMLRKVTLEDIKWIFLGLAAATLCTSVILLIWWISPIPFNIMDLKEMSPIKVQALTGQSRMVILALPIFFFFNYVGEEILWRGYILPRQQLIYRKYAWIMSGVLHGIFHFCFGIKALIPFIPFLMLMPFVVYKTKNTYTSIIVHAVIGAPMQIMVALGFIS